MKEYQLSAHGKHHAKVYGRYAKAFVVVISCIVVIPAFPLFKNADLSKLWPLLFLFLGIPIMAYFMASRRFNSSSEIRIAIDNNRLFLDRPGRRQSVIEREEVKIVLVQELGLRVISRDPQNAIFIPADLEDFEQFKTELAGWAPNVEFKIASLKKSIYWSLAVLVYLVVWYYTKSPILAWLFVSILVVAATWNFKETFQTILYTKNKWKKYRLIISVALFLTVLILNLIGYRK